MVVLHLFVLHGDLEFFLDLLDARVKQSQAAEDATLDLLLLSRSVLDHAVLESSVPDFLSGEAGSLGLHVEEEEESRNVGGCQARSGLVTVV